METTLSLRSMFRKEAMDTPVQEVFDQDLVLAKTVMKQSVTEEVITYWVEKNAQANGKKKRPGLWDLGVDEWPEMGVEQFDREAERITGLGMKLKFDAKFLEFESNQLTVADTITRFLRSWAEKFETDAFNAYTSTRFTTKGTEFDSYLTEGAAGYATTGGHIVYTPSTGKKWNAGGDPLQQLRELVTVFKTQGRTQSLDGEVRISQSLKGYTDTLTLGTMYDNLRHAGINPQPGVAPGAITVPGLFGIEFVPADYAITNNGDMLIVDEGSRPLVGYYHTYARLGQVGFRTVASESGFPMQMKDVDHDNGDASIMAACGSTYVNRMPKYTILAHDLI